MNTTELFTPIKTTSVEAEPTSVKPAEASNVRRLNPAELQHIGGGTGHGSGV
ncbi:MAG: hypothetical protein ACRDAM_04060 [Casimicrobium sp.]